MMNHLENFLLSALYGGVIFIFTACNPGTGSKKISEIPLPGIEGDFIPIPELSDEFDGANFDTLKWFRNNPTWKGRQPAFFSENNVMQSDGNLSLTMRVEEPPDELKTNGYHTFTTAAVRSRYKVKYGYFEVKAKAMNSKGGSAFWFFDQTKSLWTEIDVFEICGRGERENKYNMAVHVFYTPLENEHWAKGDVWTAPYRFADDFHVFGLEWTPYVIRWYVDGDSVRTIENTHWHQPLTMNFDSETYPDWFDLPDEKDLPSTYTIEYVRSWRYKTADWMGEGAWRKNEND